MNLKLGFFPQFKGTDAVLLAGDLEGITELSNALGSFAVSSQNQLPIHGFASISHTHPVELYASRSNEPGVLGFHWLCSPEVLPSIQGKLAALTVSGKGHHYFNLVASPVQLVVSVGEYSQSWWLAHGG